ncbi:MAG: tyrosine--tRNA ligase [Candidatus Zixiibacteriota bacterium]|jgi:tyrosyl-tRNA synthetase
MTTKTDAKTQAEVERQLALIREGALEVVTEEDMAAKVRASLASGRPLKIKLGLDPTAPDIHLGHTVVLNKLRDFQDLGHEVVFLVGDFTCSIGDPSGRSKTRPILSMEQIRANAETYCDQAFKILDPEKTTVDYNSRWLSPMTFADVIRLAAKYTVARMIERDDFSKRLNENLPISLHELFYPLAQGYDSVALEADVELGGSDQKFNLMVARDIQREFDQEPEVAVIMPLLVGTDGTQKMSKSLGNYVGVTDAPEEIYGKLMSVSDELMFDYLEILRLESAGEVKQIRADVAAGKAHPKEVKMAMARRVVELYHDAGAARAAEEHFERVHREGQAPEDMPTHTPSANPIVLATLLVEAGLAPSKSEARRLVSQNAVSINDEKVADPQAEVTFVGGEVIKVGKRRFAQIKL